jgi:alcohol dehydrogenase (cytochrome c)
LRAPAEAKAVAGDVATGEKLFFGAGECAKCHMLNGRGGLLGPDLSRIGQERTAAQIEAALRGDRKQVLPGYEPATIRLRDGRTVRGLIKNESNFDLQLQELDGNFLLLDREEIEDVSRDKAPYMPPLRAEETEIRNLLAFLSRLTGSDTRPGAAAPSAGGVLFSSLIDPKPGEWPTYHGQLGGNRHSPLNQINAVNVGQLAPKWIFPIPNSRRLEVTPVVVNGVMYVTTANEAFALDARTGRQLWHYARPLTKGLVGDAAGAINRGVAILGDRVFMVTDNAHLIALHRSNGQLLWDVEMADYRQHYGATSAPLVVKDLVISGTSGGDEGARGFIAAYKASTGERVWQFWTMPAPGEPLSETWVGRAIEHGCAAAWLTGTYDPQTDLLFWPTGNPCPDFNGDERKGDNLYSSSVLALQPDTGKLKWYFQYTPHDLHDWDAAQTPMVVDAEFQGRSRQLLLQANRNGFFYVLDRTDGHFLLAEPFVKNLNWASGVGPDGRPQVLPGAEPTIQGVKVCPVVDGATNWMSTAYNPATGLYYVMALEKCGIYTKSSAWWEPGKSFYGGGTRQIPGEPGQKFLRALDIQTGKIVWEYPQIGSARTWGGVLSTAGGLVFFGEDSGAFAALDAKTGQALWHFQTNQLWKASPMTYVAGGRQFVAVAAGSGVFAFGLP